MGLRSRGSLVAEFLAGGDSAAQLCGARHARRRAFGAFNLLLYDGRELRFASNRARLLALGQGLHAFSNAPPGVEWPKTASARAARRAVARASGRPSSRCSRCWPSATIAAGRAALPTHTLRRRPDVTARVARRSCSCATGGARRSPSARSTRRRGSSARCARASRSSALASASGNAASHAPIAPTSSMQTECAIGYACQSTT